MNGPIVSSSACTNAPSDYASGKSLFDTQDWEWFIAGSYNSHAIVQPDKVVVTYPGGFIDIHSAKDYREIRGFRGNKALK